MATYYVKNGGSDAADGLSDGNAWETTSKINGFGFNPSDVVQFKRGSSWTGTPLAPSVSGTNGNPIIFRDYSTGALPLFTPSNGGGWLDNGIFVYDIDWTYYLNLKVTGAEESGVRMYGTAQNTVVDSVEVTNSGYGVTIDDDYNTITKCYLHDLVMALNTADPTNDDRGATGVRIYSANNVVEYCRMINCIAPSYDYGYDGGGIEFYGTGIDNNIIRFNWFELCCGYLEVGSGGSGSAANNKFHHNVVKNCARAYFHLAGGFATTVSNFRIENNTFYEDGSNPRTGQQYVVAFNGTPTGSDVLFSNNIVGLHDADYDVSDENGFTHTYNSFHLTNSAGHGSHINDATEDDEDPLHTDPSNDAFRLQSNSPCIEAGADLGYTEDIIGTAVDPDTPDRGAYEYSSAGSYVVLSTDLRIGGAAVVVG